MAKSAQPNRIEEKPGYPYLERLRYDNVGPIVHIDISPSFNENGNPRPLVLVGQNGSGKSIVLSNIADAFFEIGGAAYTNARNQSEGSSQQYFKSIAPSHIKIGAPHLYDLSKYLIWRDGDQGQALTLD